MAVPRIVVSTLECLPCPVCGELLDRGAGRQGLVWICQDCRAGAVTLPILRRHAPRPFVNALWQAALHHGRPSALVCPACTQPFIDVATTFGGRIQVCVRCYWVWLDSDALDQLATDTTALPAAPHELPPPRRALRDVRRGP